MNEIKLIECFKTWQGEGPDTGRYMLLCRFKKCQLNCSYCDTKLLMNNSIEARYNIEDLQKEIKKFNLGLLITGGEPTLYNNDVVNLLNSLEFDVANIETNGYKLPELILQIKNDINVKFIYSPKNSLRDKDIQLAKKDCRIYYKFVIDKIDITEATMSFNSLKLLEKLNFDMSRVYLMPKGISFNELKTNSAAVCDLADKFNCNISTRMHLIYNFA